MYSSANVIVNLIYELLLLIVLSTEKEREDKASRYKSEARVHTSFYSHCCHPLYRCYLLQNGEL
jgi:hypothetical protein